MNHAAVEIFGKINILCDMYEQNLDTKSVRMLS